MGVVVTVPGAPGEERRKSLGELAGQVIELRTPRLSDEEWAARAEAARAEEERRAAQLEAGIAERRRARLEEAGIPAKDLALLADLRETDALATARAWLAGDRAILVLAGGKGVGKTTAASWIASQSPGASFLDAWRLMRVDTYDEATMSRLERCPLLVLDDMGGEYADAKGKLASLVDGLVNARYADMRRTVVTTNLPAAQFKARYGERVADRIREVGVFVELKGESLRGKR